MIINVNAKEYEEKYGVGSLLAKLLKASEVDDATILEMLQEGYTLSISEDECIKEAANKILEKKANNEKIFVVGDYDADGICATTIMKILLDKLEINNEYYIPNRFKDGYGISEEIVVKAKESGANLIITVDNGVRALSAIAKAKELGIEIIITDHHVIVDEIKDVLVVHPDYMDAKYKYLCGASVALEISRYLIGDDDKSTALAAVASIADVMELKGETRNIVKAGLDILNNRPPYAIISLCNDEIISADSIGFHIAPKINCIGRLADKADVNVMPYYLANDDPIVVNDISFEINNFNEERKLLTLNQFEMIEKKLNDDPFIIVKDELFHEGINGIVAGRLTETYKKPSLVMSEKDGECHGSARSVNGLNLIEFFSDIEYIEKFGGHSMAAGITIKNENFDAFYKAVTKKMKGIKLEVKDISKKYLSINPNDLKIDNVLELNKVSPMIQEVRDINYAIDSRYVSNIYNSEKIIKFIININGLDNAEAILFKASKYYRDNGFDNFKKDDYIFGRLNINEFKGNKKVQLLIDRIGEESNV